MSARGIVADALAAHAWPEMSQRALAKEITTYLACIGSAVNEGTVRRHLGALKSAPKVSQGAMARGFASQMALLQAPARRAPALHGAYGQGWEAGRRLAISVWGAGWRGDSFAESPCRQGFERGFAKTLADLRSAL